MEIKSEKVPHYLGDFLYRPRLLSRTRGGVAVETEAASAAPTPWISRHRSNTSFLEDGSPTALLLIFFLSFFLCLVSFFRLLMDGILLPAGKTERCHVTSEQSSPLNHPRGADMGFTFSGHF
ncbi:hypothetical protein KOW79_003132 [Hemibagrus wyckioides]|uniref:Uncharacterized protein n=1 Tax=Hemibagrus wyckioides TaxID=337641 RepID=A0A9D3P249_9TELE|nr:hypothetical protein KOW79_003132 [Hemibagrus wyckioides]